MKIRFRQSGGFAGITTACEIDTDKLPEAEAKRWLGLVPGRKTDLESRTRGAADVCQYEVHLQDEKRDVNWVFDELSVPPDLQALLLQLLDHAKPAKP